MSAIDFYAKEKVRLRRKGEMISDFDLLIGSTAVANDLIMVTENIRAFNRFDGIKIENWILRMNSNFSYPIFSYLKLDISVTLLNDHEYTNSNN